MNREHPLEAMEVLALFGSGPVWKSLHFDDFSHRIGEDRRRTLVDFGRPRKRRFSLHCLVCQER